MDQIAAKIEKIREQLESAVYLVAKADESEVLHKAAHTEVIKALMAVCELGNEYEKNGPMGKRVPDGPKISNADEINKVARRLKLWVNRPQQMNSRILTAYLKLEREGMGPISEQALNNELGGETTFATNFLQMRISAERNHGKVFDQNGDNVTLWPPVESAIREYEERVFGDA